MADYAITAEGDDGNLSQNATGTTGSIVTAPSGGNLLAAVTYDWTDTQAINGLRKGFLCFRDLALDPGQSISAAALRVTVHANESTARGASGVGVRVQAHKTPSGEPPTNNTSGNAQLTALTTAFVDVVSDGWAALEQRTLDVTSILQELVNQPGWLNGNDVVFWFQPFGYPSGNGTWDRIGTAFKDFEAGQEWSRLTVTLNTARTSTLTLLGVG